LISLFGRRQTLAFAGIHRGEKDAPGGTLSVAL